MRSTVATGVATTIGATDLGIAAAAYFNGAPYALNGKRENGYTLSNFKLSSALVVNPRGTETVRLTPLPNPSSR
jgi:hypothetical protein